MTLDSNAGAASPQEDAPIGSREKDIPSITRDHTHLTPRDCREDPAVKYSHFTYGPTLAISSFDTFGQHVYSK